jgi:hypothetical protein
MGTIRHRDRKTRLGFSRAGDGTSDTAGAAVLCGNLKPSPLLRTIQFQGARPLTRRENSSRARRRRLRERGRYRPVSILLRHPVLPLRPTACNPEKATRRVKDGIGGRPKSNEWTRSAVSGCGNINPLPFRVIEARLAAPIAFRQELSRPLGSTDPWSTAVPMEPFSTSVLQGPTGVFATTTKICSDGSSGRAHARHLLRIPSCPSYSPAHVVQNFEIKTCVRRPGMGDTLERHPFSGLVASAGELLHTPWRIPTSMATVLLSKATNTFRGIR